jgi:ADP-ribosylglycohydrolase
VDTTASIVGGIVAAFTGTEGIPSSWLTTREPLPPWVAGRPEQPN